MALISQETTDTLLGFTIVIVLPLLATAAVIGICILIPPMQLIMLVSNFILQLIILCASFILKSLVTSIINLILSTFCSKERAHVVTQIYSSVISALFTYQFFASNFLFSMAVHALATIDDIKGIFTAPPPPVVESVPPSVDVAAIKPDSVIVDPYDGQKPTNSNKFDSEAFYAFTISNDNPYEHEKPSRKCNIL